MKRFSMTTRLLHTTPQSLQLTLANKLNPQCHAPLRFDPLWRYPENVTIDDGVWHATFTIH